MCQPNMCPIVLLHDVIKKILVINLLHNQIICNIRNTLYLNYIFVSKVSLFALVLRKSALKNPTNKTPRRVR